jgi:rhamnose transport system substrate-binding protein
MLLKQRPTPAIPRRRGLTVLLAPVLLLTLLLTACGGGTGSSGTTSGNGSASGSAPVKLYMIPKFTGIPPFTQANQGAQEFAKQFGYQLSYGGPTSSSATQQVQFINSAVAKGYKGIFISADDPAAVTPALQRAQQNGVAVVSFDSDVLPAGRSIYVQGTSAQQIADVQLEMLGSQINYTGDFVILSAQATDSNQVQWNKLLVQELKTNPKYKNMHLVTIINPPDDSTPSAVQYAQSILKEYPTIKGIIAPTTIAVAAAAQVVQQENACDKYVVTGLGDPKQMESFVTSKCVKKFALWSFSREGQVAMCAMHALLSHQITGKSGDSFTCGNLGSFSVGDQGTVTAGPPTVFTADNLDQYTF